MVLKRGKHGLNTGCSLKLGRYMSYYQQNSTREHALVIQPGIQLLLATNEQNRHICTEMDQQLQDTTGLSLTHWYNYDSSSMDFPVIRSLNKKKRWLLKDIIIGYINDISRNPEKDTNTFNISAVQRCVPVRNFKRNSPSFRDFFRWLCNKNTREPAFPFKLPDCLSYHNSHNELPHVHARDVYSYQSDLALVGESAALLMDQHPSEWRPSRRRHHNERVRGLQRKGAYLKSSQLRNMRYSLWDCNDELASLRKKWLVQYKYTIVY